MSSSKEKKRRMLEKEQGTEKKDIMALEEQKQKKKTRNLAIIVVALVVVLLAIALLINSNFLRRNVTAVEIDGMKFTVSDFDFQYYNNYYDYVSYVYTNYSDYASSLLPDSSKPFESQQYDEERTWKDFFQEYAMTNLTRNVALYNEGHEAGFELSDEDKAEITTQLDNMTTSATSYGYSNVGEYIKAYYGKSVTYDIFEENLEFITYAKKYEEFYKESLTYTDEEIAAKYKENKDMYDRYDFKYFTVFADTVDESAYETEEEATTAKEAAAEVARQKAAEYLERIKAGESFDALAKEYDSEKYTEEGSSLRSYNGNLLGSTYGDWLRDAARVSGDASTFDISTGTYVVQFVGRSDNHYNTVNMRTIAIIPEAVNESDYSSEEDDTAYNAAVDAAKEAAKAKAEDIYKQWKDGDATEDSFAQLAIDNSGDTMAAEGGLWEDVYDGQYSSEINTWLYDAARKPGDTTVLYSDDAGSYFVIYYSGSGMVYAEYLAKEDLRNTDENEWDTALVADISARKTWLFSLTV